MSKLNPTLLAEYFSGKKQNPLYGPQGKATTLYKALKTHADGLVPEKLLNERRPNESVAVFEYRKKIYKSKTQGPFGRVVNTLAKIRRSPDWAIRYDAKTQPPQIASGQTLQVYCEENYPQYTSVTNWVFKVLLKNYLLDANAVVVVKPIEWEVEATDYLQPIAHIYNSDKVIELTDDFCILKSDETVDITLESGYVKQGKVFWVITTNAFLKYEEKADGKFVKTEEEKHGLGLLPVFKMQGNVVESTPKHTLFESRLAPMVPSFDEAAREYSDQQANMVAHIYPERWEYEGQSCPVCWDNGQKRSTGFVRIKSNGKTDRYEPCNSCNGTGSGTKAGPYSSIVIRPAKTTLGEQPSPIPPAGYIQKDVAIPEFQEKRIQSHIYEALAAINMEHLAEVPMAQSGVAKTVDRDDFNNFVHGIAEDIIAITDRIYLLIAEYRYRIIVPEDSRRKRMLPKINVPENYDLLIANNLVEEIKQAKEAGVSPTILTELQMGYASAKFYNNPQVRDELNCIFELDPLPGIDDDSKVTRLTNKGITVVDYVISANIEAFVRRARVEQPKFYTLPYAEKRKQLEKYANEVVKKNSEQVTENSKQKESEKEVKPEAKPDEPKPTDAPLAKPEGDKAPKPEEAPADKPAVPAEKPTAQPVA